MTNRCPKKDCVYHDVRHEMEYPCIVCTVFTPTIVKTQNYYGKKRED